MLEPWAARGVVQSVRFVAVPGLPDRRLSMAHTRTLQCVTAAVAAVFCTILVGCEATPTTTTGGAPSIRVALSPLAGTWSGKSDLKDKGLGSFQNALGRDQLTGPSSATLSADGTGFVKASDQPERPVTWRAEGEKVLFEPRSTGDATAPPPAGDDPVAGSGGFVGTLSEDRKTLVLDLPKVTVTLRRKAA
jgi:hypothetical protein